MTDVNPMDVRCVKRPTLAIVQLRTQIHMPHRVHYQVFIDPTQMSPTKTFIRFGNVHGDELVGWQRCDDIEVREVFGECDIADVPYINKTSFPVALNVLDQQS